MMKKSGVYKITSPSKKIYIGQSSNLDQRIKDYVKTKHCKGQVRLYNSLIKYGFENHTFEVIEYCEFDDLNKRERYWQDYYDAIGVNGLNCKLTPCDGKKMILSEEARKKISDKVKINQPMRRKEMRELFSKRLSGKNNPMYKRSGFLNKKSSVVLDMCTGVFYGSIAEAAEAICINYSTLRAMLSNINKNKTTLIKL
jgi:group I intron endonuclease